MLYIGYSTDNQPDDGVNAHPLGNKATASMPAWAGQQAVCVHRYEAQLDLTMTVKVCQYTVQQQFEF
jgi:hypothetical protein